MQHPVIVGKFGAPFGVRGFVKITSFTDPIENILDYEPWFVRKKDQWQPLDIAEKKLQGNSIIARLNDCDDRNEVALLTNHEIAVEREQFDELGDGDFYWTDLEGLEVIDTAGTTLGNVDHLFETGANDVIVVKGQKEILIPYTDQAIKAVDLAAGKITVDWHYED